IGGHVPHPLRLANFGVQPASPNVDTEGSTSQPLADSRFSTRNYAAAGWSTSISSRTARAVIALCPKENCLPPGISQYADVASEPRQQLPPPGDVDQPTNTRTFQHDRGARCVCHRSLQLRYPADVAGPASFQ